MKDDKFFWNYEKEPGKVLKNDYIKGTEEKPLVSIITSYYNSQEFMWQTINCVLNQTFPYWEWIIVDDGSTDENAVKYLEEVKNIDSRIKIYHKENEGLAKGRDYAIKYSSTNYVLPLDADDLIEPTYIETLYWTLETNKDASWAFTNSLGFGKYVYLVDQVFDSEKMKTENQITATALIRKDKILSLGGYGVAKRYVNEDWHLWLRMLAHDYFPVQVTYYGFWYRRRKESLLTEINDDKKQENELRLRDLKIEADKITKRVETIIYPNKEHNINSLQYIALDWQKTLPENGKNYVLYILPNTGLDKGVYKSIKKESYKSNIIIITLDNTKHSHYALRQKYEEFSTVFDLTTFLDGKYWLGFIEYIIKTRNISNIYVSDDYKDVEFLKNKITATIEYKESNFKYSMEILKYKVEHLLPFRAVKKCFRIIKQKLK